MLYTPNIVRRSENPPIIDSASCRGGVLIRATNWLGDVMMTLPATWQIRRMLPEGTPLWVLTPAGLAPLWKAASWIDGVIPMAEHHIAKDEIALVKEHGFQLGIVLPNSFGSARDIHKCGIPMRLGRRGNLRSFMLTHTLPRWKNSGTVAEYHQLSYYLELASALGKIELTADYPGLRVSPDFAAEHGVRKGEKWLAMAPGANFGPAKEWPREFYRIVAQWWIEHGGKVLLVGTKNERKITAEIASGLENVLDMAGKTTLDQLMSLLANVDLLLANDSGSMHLAAGLGTGGVAVFASTDHVATGPLGAKWSVVAADVNCRPCFQRKCLWRGLTAISACGTCRPIKSKTLSCSIWDWRQMLNDLCIRGKKEPRINTNKHEVFGKRAWPGKREGCSAVAVFIADG